MAYIDYVPADQVPEEDRIADQDNIIRISGIHSRVMKRHYGLYLELLHRRGPLSRVQRELIGVVVSAANECHY